MSRRNTAFVLGYHGCDRKLADKVIKGKASLAPSDSKFDWVGPGIYFWEADPLRAWEWAESRCREGSYTQPGVVGAIIDLRECLDLLTRDDQELVRVAHASMAALYEKAGRALPTNRNSKRDKDTDRKIRELDCAVIKHLHSIMDYDFDEAEAEGEAGDPMPFYDTVRAMFTEGEPLYEGAAFTPLPPRARSPSVAGAAYARAHRCASLGRHQARCRSAACPGARGSDGSRGEAIWHPARG